MPERTAGLRDRRDKKNEVDIISNCHPRVRAIASAFGTFGVSINPKRKRTSENVLLIMTQWLPEDEGTQLRFEFETEIAKLEAA